MHSARAQQQEKPLQGEARALQLERSPHSPQLTESPHAAMKTQHSQETNKSIKKNTHRISRLTTKRKQNVLLIILKYPLHVEIVIRFGYVRLD